MADLTKIESSQYPSSHFGHLTEQQQDALNKFKDLCQERGYYHPAGEGGRKYASHDDETLLSVIPTARDAGRRTFILPICTDDI
jgi:hypothetical protein